MEPLPFMATSNLSRGNPGMSARFAVEKRRGLVHETNVMWEYRKFTRKSRASHEEDSSPEWSSQTAWRHGMRAQAITVGIYSHERSDALPLLKSVGYSESFIIVLPLDPITGHFAAKFREDISYQITRLRSASVHKLSDIVLIFHDSSRTISLVNEADGVVANDGE